MATNLAMTLANEGYEVGLMDADIHGPNIPKMLGIEVIVGNPFSKVKVDPAAVKTLAGYAPLYSIAAGLAMREV